MHYAAKIKNPLNWSRTDKTKTEKGKEFPLHFAANVSPSHSPKN
jgi:hypothetical protein